MKNCTGCSAGCALLHNSVVQIVAGCCILFVGLLFEYRLAERFCIFNERRVYVVAIQYYSVAVSDCQLCKFVVCYGCCNVGCNVALSILVEQFLCEVVGQCTAEVFVV